MFNFSPSHGICKPVYSVLGPSLEIGMVVAGRASCVKIPGDTGVILAVIHVAVASQLVVTQGEAGVR